MLTRGKSVFAPVFSSRLASAFTRYVDLKRALGRRFDVPSRTLQSLDRFLHDHRAEYPDLNAAAFEAWCRTHERVSSGVRRVRMLEVRAFCLYRRRTEPQCFVPDPSSFPAYHQRVQPYIFSEIEVAKLLRAASGLPRYPASPVRPEVIRLAIILLFTTGMRRGELLGLTLGDYDRRELTLHIRETKFYKSRILPINGSIAEEMDKCLRARTQRKLPVSPDTALIWNAAWGGGAYSGIGLRHALQPLLQECGIVTPKGKRPRIHDFRHSFAVNTLRRCWGKTTLAGDLPGAWFGGVDALLPALHRTTPHGDQRAFRESLRRVGLPAAKRREEA
jgi:integrase/recombinase XerD